MANPAAAQQMMAGMQGGGGGDMGGNIGKANMVRMSSLSFCLFFFLSSHTFCIFTILVMRFLCVASKLQYPVPCAIILSRSLDQILKLMAILQNPKNAAAILKAPPLTKDSIKVLKCIFWM